MKNNKGIPHTCQFCTTKLNTNKQTKIKGGFYYLCLICKSIYGGKK